MKCPYCPRNTTPIPSEEGLTCGCHLRAPVLQVTAGKQKRPKLEAAQNLVDESGFIEVKPHGRLCAYGIVPRVFKKVEGEGLLNYIVIYSDVFTNGNFHCPECGSYQASITLLNGSYDTKPCTQNLRPENDGMKGVCKTVTRFIVRNQHNLTAGGGTPAVF